MIEEGKMAKKFKEFSKVIVQFISLRDADDIVEFESVEKFDTVEELDEFIKKVMGLLSPLKDKGHYTVEMKFRTEERDTEKPDEIKED